MGWMYMIRKLLFIIYLLLIFTGSLFSIPVQADQNYWTEKKLGKVILKAERAAHQRRWTLAIKYGEEMLRGSDALDQHSDARYINQLKNLNLYYDKADRLKEVAARVVETYSLSKKYLGLQHKTTLTSRHLYYKLLLINKKYNEAISIVLENISTIGNKRNEKLKYLRYLEQLSTLYGLTKQLEKEEETLVQLLNMNTELLSSSDEDNLDIILNLAENYCRQNKVGKFEKLITTHNLKYFCK